MGKLPKRVWFGLKALQCLATGGAATARARLAPSRADNVAYVRADIADGYRAALEKIAAVKACEDGLDDEFMQAVAEEALAKGDER